MTRRLSFKSYITEQLSYEDFVNQALQVLDLESLDQLSEPEAKKFLGLVTEVYSEHFEGNK